MERKLISSGSPMEKEIGYSRAVVDGNWIFISGTTGFDYQKMIISEDIVSQTEQCFKNIISTLKQAESKIEDVVQAYHCFRLFLNQKLIGISNGWITIRFKQTTRG